MTPSDDLTSVEQDVIRVLAESRVTASAVTLAADLWRTSPDWKMFDCEPLIRFVVEGLAERGLVKYILPNPHAQMGQRLTLNGAVLSSYNGPVRIRLTSEGWAAAGYPNMTIEVGSLQRHRISPRAGDYTDYRHHSDTALGGPIKSEDIWTHMDLFPSHIHDLGDIRMPNSTGTRQKVTPDLEARVLAGRTVLGPTASLAEIAERVGVTERMARYILTDLPRMRRLEDPEPEAKGSLKERIVMALREFNDFRDVAELRNILGRADTDHDVVHVLHSLHTQGLVDFKEDRDGKAPIHIHLTNRGKGAGLKNGEAKTENPSLSMGRAHTEAPVHATGAIVRDEDIPPARLAERQAQEREKVEATERLTAYAEPKPTLTLYPLLDALLERERKRMEQDSAGMAYVTAAEAIEKIDPDAAKMLMAKAEALNVAFPSPIEQEYLLYVANHS